MEMQDAYQINQILPAIFNLGMLLAVFLILGYFRHRVRHRIIQFEQNMEFYREHCRR